MTGALILGLSSGSACLATCGMVMFPYLMAGSADVKRIAIDLSLFLFTRLVIYFILATLAWYFGQALFSNPVVRNIVPGILYIVFAVMLVWYSISKNQNQECPAKIVKAVNNRRLVPIFLGIVNSLVFCPALFIILTKGATQGTLVQSYFAFLAFFIGSSVWFLPLPLAGKIRKKEVLKNIGILATGLAGIIFMIKGLTNLIGGIING
ncbi:MAG: sulfite exporter TauE/SafE family protein [Bacteroidia bacterium]|nr:sulfite exporter TauE/SafE family protein [Bacteroidia bacterium]